MKCCSLSGNVTAYELDSFAGRNVIENEKERSSSDSDFAMGSDNAMSSSSSENSSPAKRRAKQSKKKGQMKDQTKSAKLCGTSIDFSVVNLP